MKKLIFTLSLASLFLVNCADDGSGDDAEYRSSQDADTSAGDDPSQWPPNPKQSVQPQQKVVEVTPLTDDQRAFPPMERPTRSVERNMPKNKTSHFKLAPEKTDSNPRPPSSLKPKPKALVRQQKQRIENGPVVMSWERSHAEGKKWTAYALKTMDEVAPHLTKVVPKDIASYCGNYQTLRDDDRKLFWVAFLAAMSLYESSHNPGVKYKESPKDGLRDVVSRGLLQLSVPSVNYYGCAVRDAKALHDPQINIKCALRIMNKWALEDEVIRKEVKISKKKSKWLGMARYWGVVRKIEKLNKIKKEVNRSQVCTVLSV